MKIKSVSIIILAQLICVNYAYAQWRTPPIKTVGNETVSCDLLNNSGSSLTASNLEINVRTLEGDRSSNVVLVPGPFVIDDGRGVRGSSPNNVLTFRTVYCELDSDSIISVEEKDLFFTMTVEDDSGKSVTTATPRPAARGTECGQPSFNAGSDKDIFIWKNCDAAGDWRMRATGGGDPDKQTYIGSISSNLGFTAFAPFSIESSDTLDNTSNPNVIDFTLGMRNAGQDGVDFDFPDGANTCFDVSTLPAGSQVLLGETNAPMMVPFDLMTQGSCL